MGGGLPTSLVGDASWKILIEPLRGYQSVLMLVSNHIQKLFFFSVFVSLE